MSQIPQQIRADRDRPAALAASEASQAKAKRENAKHTPGPWRTKREGFSTIYVEAPIGGGWVQEIAACGPTNDGSAQQEANARLIAAAPELMEALQGLVAVLDRQLHSPHAAERASPLGRARAAIAKATGDTE